MDTPNITVNHARALARINSILLYAVFSLLLFGPLGFGAVEPWSIFIVEAGATALFLLWISKQLLNEEIKIRMNPLFLPMGVFGGLIVLQLIFHNTAYPHDSISGALLYCA